MSEMTNQTDTRNDRLAGGTAAEKGESGPAARSDTGGEGKGGEVPKLDQSSFPDRAATPSAAELEAMQKQVDSGKKA